MVEAFKFTGVYTLEEVTTSTAMPYLGAEIGGIFGLGFILHVILTRINPAIGYRQIYLTGHVMWTMAGMLALVLNNFGFKGWESITIGTIFLAIYLTISCAMMWLFIKKITNGRWGFGHTQSFGIFFSGWISRALGNPENDAEKLPLPKGLEFVKEPAIISAIIMLVVYLLPTIYVGPGIVETQFSGGKNYIVWAIIQGITFAAGVEIILTGVRMFIGEIIPAFKGISEKVIPGSLPGLDCPTIYPFAPVSLMLGVILHIIFTVTATLIQVATRSPLVILPNAIYMFFVGASTGIVANKEGGVRGIAIACLHYLRLLLHVCANRAIAVLGTR